MRKSSVIIGAGMVGTHTAAALSKIGYGTHVVDLNPKSGYFLRYGPPGDDSTLSTVDVREPLELSEFAKKIETPAVVVLCFGLAGKKASANPDAARKVYLDGIRNAIELFSRLGTRRFVFTSSLGVYGESMRTSGYRESDELGPATPYGEIVAEAETLIRSYSDIEAVIVRCAGIYGPNRIGYGSHSTRLIEQLLFASRKGGNISIEGNLDYCDDYVYVKDVARGLALSAASSLPEREAIYNLGTGRVSSLGEIFSAIQDVFPSVTYTIKTQADKVVGRRIPLDIDLISNDLNFVPEFPLLKGIRDYAQVSGLI